MYLVPFLHPTLHSVSFSLYQSQTAPYTLQSLHPAPLTPCILHPRPYLIRICILKDNCLPLTPLLILKFIQSLCCKLGLLIIKALKVPYHHVPQNQWLNWLQNNQQKWNISLTDTFCYFTAINISAPVSTISIKVLLVPYNLFTIWSTQTIRIPMCSYFTLYLWRAVELLERNLLVWSRFIFWLPWGNFYEKWDLIHARWDWTLENSKTQKTRIFKFYEILDVWFYLRWKRLQLNLVHPK